MVAVGVLGVVVLGVIGASLATDDEGGGAAPATTDGSTRSATAPTPTELIGSTGATATTVSPTATTGASARPSAAPTPTGSASSSVAIATTGLPTLTNPPVDEPGSLSWVVTKEWPAPSDYVPPDLVTPDVPLKPDTGATELRSGTAAAFEELVSEAEAAGHQLMLTSGYRSYDQQQMLYDRFVQDYGAEVAAQRVAEPGTSEHQTGLAADVGLVGLSDDQEFGSTDASVWVAQNAHRFGFVVRYLDGKEHITGYGYEPWHLRHVGVELATELHRSGLTMEEHFGLAD